MIKIKGFGAPVLPCRFREWLYTRRVKPARISLLLLLTLSALWISCALAQPVPAQTSLPVSPPLPNLLLLQELETPGPVSALVWSSNGTKLAVGSIGQPSTIPIIPPVRLANIFGMLITIFHSEGRVDQQIRRTKAFFVYDDTFAFVGDNKLLATPPVEDKNAFALFDVDTGELVREIPGLHPGRQRTVNGAKMLVASPDQKLLAVIFGRAIEQNAIVYSTKDWSKLADLPDGPSTQPRRPEIAAFSRDGKLIAIGGFDRYASVYDAGTWHLVREVDAFPDRSPGTSDIAFSPDGSMIALGSSGTAGVNTLPSGRLEFVPLNNSPVRIFRIDDGTRIAEYGKPAPLRGGLAWSPDGRFIAFITERRILHIWSPLGRENPERTIELSRTREAGVFALSPDGAMLAVGIGQNVRMYRIVN
jgi:hypothetical protein